MVCRRRKSIHGDAMLNRKTFALRKGFYVKKPVGLIMTIVCVLAGICQAQSGGVSGLRAKSAITISSFASLFREGIEVSRIERTFPGSVCAKGRITLEFEDFFDGTGIVLEPSLHIAPRDRDKRRVRLRRLRGAPRERTRCKRHCQQGGTENFHGIK